MCVCACLSLSTFPFADLVRQPRETPERQEEFYLIHFGVGGEVKGIRSSIPCDFLPFPVGVRRKSRKARHEAQLCPVASMANLRRVVLPSAPLLCLWTDVDHNTTRRGGWVGGSFQSERR